MCFEFLKVKLCAFKIKSLLLERFGSDMLSSVWASLMLFSCHLLPVCFVTQNRTGCAEITCVHLFPGLDCQLVEDTATSYESWILISSPIPGFPIRIKLLFLQICVYAYYPLGPVLDISHALSVRRMVIWLLLLFHSGEWRFGEKFCLGICSGLGCLTWGPLL